MIPSVSCCPLLTIAVKAVKRRAPAHLVASPVTRTGEQPRPLPRSGFPQFPQPLWKTGATGGRVANFFDYLQVPGNLNKNLSTFLKCYRG